MFKKLYLTYSATFTNLYYLRLLIPSLQASLLFKVPACILTIAM